MNVQQCLIDGGVPNGCTDETLRWLAQAHRNLAQRTTTPHDDRDHWHLRWAAFIEGILETRYGRQ